MTQTPRLRARPRLATQADRVLSLLTPPERAGVLKYYHVRDAKMALASALLKHYAVSKLAGVPWRATGMTRDERTKPVWRDPATGGQPVSFNVSHQAGIVALVATTQDPAGACPAQLGVDVVCTSERRGRDHDTVRTDGWPAFVDMHADVLAPAEAAYLKHQVLSAIPRLDPARTSRAHLVDARLRSFYALWALREAYVKLTGDALLADWLRELEFRAWRPPAPTPAWTVPAAEDEVDGGRGGQVIRKVDVRLRGRAVEDVNICLRSMGPDYMICTAARTPEDKGIALGWRLGPYEILSLEDIMQYAEASIKQTPTTTTQGEEPKQVGANQGDEVSEPI